MTPTFNTLPTPHCPEFAPESVQNEYKAVCEARQAIETKRADVLKALQKARTQDLAVFTPVQYDARPMLQEELLFRRAYGDYLRSLMSSLSAYVNQCEADLERAREEVKGRLLAAGYVEPDGGAGRGTYSPDMVQRHLIVRSAIEKRDSTAGTNFGDLSRANQQEITAIEAKLRNLLVSAS